MSPVQRIPHGYRTVTPHLTIAGAAKAIEFYAQAFGARELSRAPMPGSDMLMHAAIQIGDSIVMMHDEMPGPEGCPQSPTTLKGSPVTIHLYFEDVDLCARIRRTGRRIRYWPRAEVVHLGGASVATDPSAVALRYRQSQLHFYRKHHGQRAVERLRILLAAKLSLERLFAMALGRRENRKLAEELLTLVREFR